ncbi:toxic anion resistance protein [Bacillus pacificus]
MNNPVVLDSKTELNEQTAQDVRLQLRQDADVQRIYNAVDIKDQLELIELGKEPSMEISRFADQILHTMSLSKIEDSGELLKQLGKIMDRFDSKDFAEEKSGFFSRMFKKADKMIEQIFSKYQTMGREIDKVYVEITKYQDEMKKSIGTLDGLYEQNLKYYLDLEKYVVAGEMLLERLNTELVPMYEERVRNNDQLAGIELESLKNSVEILEQRIDDLEKARMVALLTAPQIRMIQRGNNKLIGKINTAFITTIPIFKNGIIQAVNAKRQKLVADSMAELDSRTNELLKKNAQNIATQSVEVARLSGSSSIKMETLEETWNIISRGMQETQQIEEQNKREREESRKRMATLTENIKKRITRVNEKAMRTIPHCLLVFLR